MIIYDVYRYTNDSDLHNFISFISCTTPKLPMKENRVINKLVFYFSIKSN